jgi:HK97 family phage prohead protease
MSKITLEAKGEFPFEFYIEKAMATEEDGKLIVEGIASTVNVDHDNERMAMDALKSMASMVNDQGVPLRYEHNAEKAAIIGNVYKAWVDSRNQLWIRAAIDASHPAGPMLHENLKKGSKYGLSVGGRVRNAVREMVESTGKMVKTFYDVVLDEVSVTRKPANYDAWLFAKSIKAKDADVSPYYDSPMYNKFLFENPKLDYLVQFAKSVPDNKWEKISNLVNKDMSKEDNKEEKKDEMKETEKSFVTKGQFDKLADLVAKGFSGIGNLIKAMGDSPKETVNPNKDKAEDDTQQTAKAREGQEDDGGNGTKDAEGKKTAANNARETENPSKDKPKEEEQQTAKAEDKKDDKEEDTEKAADDDKKDEEKDTEKAADDEDKKDEKDYEMKSISDAIAHIDGLTKGMKSVKVTKSEKTDKVEKSAESKVSSIDRFAVSVAMFADTMAEKFEKSGTRVPGLAQMIADAIRTDSGLQSDLMGMLKEAGFKKSVSMGVPYMVTKDGKKYALTAKAVEEVQKSDKGPQDFKSVFKSKFSSIAPQEQS